MEQEILTLQELDSEEWKVRARESVEHAYDEAGNSTVESDAQETLLNFILRTSSRGRKTKWLPT